MAYATTIFTPIRRDIACSRWSCEPCDHKQRLWWDIDVRPDHDILLEEGEFQISQRERGIRRIGVFTGRTRRIGGTPCPTLEVYDVDTVVEMVGDLPVIVGRRGERIPGGTWYTSPNAVRPSYLQPRAV